jgi:hypothetical protein
MHFSQRVSFFLISLLLLLRPSGSNLIEEASIIDTSNILLLNPPIFRPHQDPGRHPYRKSQPLFLSSNLKLPLTVQERLTHIQKKLHPIQTDPTPISAPSCS